MRKFLQFTLSLLAMLMVTLNASAWSLVLKSPAAGEVESLKTITIDRSEDGWFLYEMGEVSGATLSTPNGNISVKINIGVTPYEISFAEQTTPGNYTLSIPAGVLHKDAGDWLMGTSAPGEGNTAAEFTWTIPGGQQGGGQQTTGWTFTSVTPATGEVESINGFEFTIGSSNGLNLVKNLTLTCDDGNDYVITMQDNFTGTISGYLDDPITTPGTYTINIPAGYYEDWALKANAEMTYSWTIKGNDTPTIPEHTIAYDKAEGKITVTWPEGTTIVAADALFGISGTIDEITVMGGTWTTQNVIDIYTTLAAGDHTLNIAAGQFTINGISNPQISETFTVTGGTQGGGDHDFTGDPFHETIFKSGETVPAIPFVIDNDNVNITTVGKPFMDTTIDVGYNMYDTKELNWKNGTKFVFTAKKDINKVIFVPTDDSKNAIAYASAEGGDGAYNNGVWEGKLATGETLTLTAGDGINIKEFYICYNGDDFDPTAGGEDEKGVITIQYPTENQLIEKQVDGGKFCVFTTNKEYAQVTIEVKNSNEAYDNLFKFPTRMVDNMGEKSDNLHVGENTIYAATPASGAAGKGDDWYWFKGDSYTMIVKGYVNPWDTEYDAIAEVHFVGNGKEHVAESLVKLLNVTPATSNESYGKIAMVNGVITLEFDGPVTSVKAVTPEGMAGEKSHTATPKADSDNKIWEINLGDQSNFGADTDGASIIEVDVTATAADGIVVFSNTRADRGLELKYELVAGDGPTPSAVTLGTPTWSVAEGAEIEASTTSINIKFPNAENVEGDYTLEVAGTIADKQMNYSIVSGTGTMANGADITVTLAEDVAYNLAIGTITIKDANGATVYSTEQGNFQLNFATTNGQGGGDAEIEVSGDNICTIFTFVNESDVAPSWNAPITVNGTDLTGKFEMGQEWNEIYFIPEESLADGKYDVEFAVGSLMLNSQSENTEAYNVTFYVVNGKVTMTAPQPTSVVLYEEGVDTHTSGTELNFSKNGVTLTSETTGNETIQNYFKPAVTNGHLRLFSYNTLKFAAEREIVKIEFVPINSLTKYQAKSVSSGEFADNVWTGESKTVDLVINGTNIDILKIIVTLKEEAPAPQPEELSLINCELNDYTPNGPLVLEARDENGNYITAYFDGQGNITEDFGAPVTIMTPDYSGQYSSTSAEGSITTNADGSKTIDITATFDEVGTYHITGTIAAPVPCPFELPSVVATTEEITFEFDLADAVEGLDTPQLDATIIVIKNGVEYTGGISEADVVDGKVTATITTGTFCEGWSNVLTLEANDEIEIIFSPCTIWCKNENGSWSKSWTGDIEGSVKVTVQTGTGINSIIAGSANAPIYNVAGQQIKSAKGLVIKNGKKMFVK